MNVNVIFAGQQAHCRARVIRIAAAAVLACGLIAAQEPKSAAQPANSTLNVSGDVATPLQLKLEDLAKMPRETVTVHEQDGSSVTYEGVPLREVLSRAGAPLGKSLRGKALATYILARAHDGYEVLFAIGEVDTAFGNESILVADKREGKPLFGYQGPLRLTIPNDKAGARSVRMLETLEVVQLRK